MTTEIKNAAALVLQVAYEGAYQDVSRIGRFEDLDVTNSTKLR